MTSFNTDIPPNAFKDQVFVLTGGSAGIGLSTVQLLASHGAHVVFGDIQPPPPSILSAHPTVTYHPTDVTSYASLLALFTTAHTLHSHIDHALSNAGIIEQGHWFTPQTIESVQTPPPTATLDVNLLGTLYFARIALAYLAANTVAENRSLTLMSSVAGFKETPQLPVYAAAKAGVLGLMRSLRVTAPGQGVRVNAVCPWSVETGMTEPFTAAWKEAGLPLNQPGDVAAVVAALAAGRVHGEAVYVEGGRGWCIERRIEACEGEWLGVEASRSLARGMEFLGTEQMWDVK